MMSTENYSKAKKLINEAGAIIIGAGAGLSSSAGINYGQDKFKENFPELYQKYGFTDFYTSSFYKFSSEEEKWSYWAKHINYLCLNAGKTDVYQNLYQIVKNKNYFVITTNVDRQFIQNGFDENKVFEVQGALTKIQCSKACHNKLYDNTKLIKEMLKQDKNCHIPSDLVPYCPKCHEPMDVNLRKDEYFVEDTYWHQQSQNYENFIKKHKNQKILFIELGAGYNTPGIIRFPFEQMTYQMKDAHLIRVNLSFNSVPKEIENKSISFKEDAQSFITHIQNN